MPSQIFSRVVKLHLEDPLITMHLGIPRGMHFAKMIQSFQKESPTDFLI